MDPDNHGDATENGFEEKREMPAGFPADLPRSLNDRRSFTPLPDETEMYDAWQGI